MYSFFLNSNTGGPPLVRSPLVRFPLVRFFFAIGIKSVLVESEWDCYVVKLARVEIGYVVLTSMIFA